MRFKKRSPKRAIECRMRGTSAMSMPVPMIIFSRCSLPKCFSQLRDGLRNARGSRVDYDMLAIPRLILAGENFFPRYAQSGNVGWTCFQAFTMQLRTRTRNFDFKPTYSGQIRDLSPSVASHSKWIDGICNHSSAEEKIVFGDRVGNAIPRFIQWPVHLAAITEGLLDGVDAQIHRAELTSQLSGNRCLSHSRQSAQDDQHGSRGLRRETDALDTCSHALKEPVSTVNQFAVYHASFCGQAMRFDGAGPVNVQHFMPARHQPVGDQHTVAAEVYALGTHISGAGALCQRNHFGDRVFEFRGQHVVRVIAEACIAKPDVRGVFATLLAIAAKGLHPDVVDSGRWQTLFKRFAIELRQPPRHGEGADIHQGFNPVSLKRLE